MIFSYLLQIKNMSSINDTEVNKSPFSFPKSHPTHLQFWILTLSKALFKPRTEFLRHIEKTSFNLIWEKCVFKAA